MSPNNRASKIYEAKTNRVIRENFILLSEQLIETQLKNYKDIDFVKHYHIDLIDIYTSLYLEKSLHEWHRTVYTV